MRYATPILTFATLAVGQPTTQPAPLKPVAVTASAAESKAAGGVGDFPARKTVDGDLAAASSWRAEVRDEKAGQWIQYDLGDAKAIAAVRIAFVKGEERVYRFTIELSADGKDWQPAFTGGSSGKDKGFETFTLVPATARY